jgi:hypothetical protein
MAYGNWGAWVYRNGVHMPTHEDQTPYREELEAGYFQAFRALPDGVGVKLDETLNPHHAVLGSGRVRLCGYKSYPVLFLDGQPVDLDAYVVDRDDEGDTEWRGELEGYRFQAELADYDHRNKVDLLLVEPDGTRWTARSGYCIGSGWDDEPWDYTLWPKEA